MSIKRSIMKVSIMMLVVFFPLSNAVHAHEPLFGLGPHTLYQYGWAVESEFAKEGRAWAYHMEFLYGVTPDLAVTLGLPVVFPAEGKGSGIGDIIFRGKYRFYRNDALNQSDQAAFHAGIKLPSGDQFQDRGTGTTDVFLALSFGHESRRHYYWGSVVYQINGKKDNLHRSNIFETSVAYGIRPWLNEYHQPDSVLLIELTRTSQGHNRLNSIEVENTGGRIISIGPGILFSVRNVMLKAGMKIPIAWNLNGSQEKPDTEYEMGVELHLPPLF